jgi:hypothetical protein
MRPARITRARSESALRLQLLTVAALFFGAPV